MQKIVDASQASVRLRGRRLIAGLLSPAIGPMTNDMATALAELERLIEQRADEVVRRALSSDAPWIARCGGRPLDPNDRLSWGRAVRVVAAYRDRYGYTEDDALGPVPLTELERLDHHRAGMALRSARWLASGQALTVTEQRSRAVNPPDRS